MSNQIIDHKRGEVNELRQLLKNPSLQRNIHKQRDVLKKIISYITIGIDISDIYSEMILCASTRDIINKKMIYLYLSFYARSKSSLSILLINTLYNDCMDYDPQIRGLALRTLCNLNLSNTTDYINYCIPKINTCINDTNYYVKKIAVVSIAKMVRIDCKIIQPGGICDTYIDMLVGMLQNESNQYIVISIINTLNDIYHTLNTDQLYILANHRAIQLLSQLNDYNEWNQCQLLTFISYCNITNHEQIFDIMNLLETKLLCNNTAIIICILNIFIKLTLQLQNDNVYSSVYSRIYVPLITLMNSGTNELTYIILIYLHILVQQKPGLFHSQYASFYIRDSIDSVAVKKMKISILTILCNDSNYNEILNELSYYVNESDIYVSLKIIESIGIICIQYHTNHSIVNECIQHITSYFELHNCDIVNKTIEVIQHIVQYTSIDINSINNDLLNTTIAQCVYYNDKLHDTTKICFIWLLAHHSTQLHDAPYLIESLYIQPWITHRQQYTDHVKYAILHNTMKIFFVRPNETQSMLGELLYCAINDTIDEQQISHTIHDTATLYYKLLRYDTNKAKLLFLHELPPSMNGAHTPYNNKLQNDSAWLLQYNTFLTLCVVYNQSPDKFIKSINEYTELIDSTVDDLIHNTDAIDAIAEPILPNNNEESPKQPQVQPPENTYNNNKNSTIDLFSLDNIGGDTTTANTSALQLQSNPSIDKSTYQSKWQSLPTSHTFKHTLTSTITNTSSIELLLQQHNIYTFASGAVNDRIKLYHYSRNNTNQLYLIECIIQSQDNTLQAVFKTEASDIQPYIQIFHQAIHTL